MFFVVLVTGKGSSDFTVLSKAVVSDSRCISVLEAVTYRRGDVQRITNAVRGPGRASGPSSYIQIL